MGNTCHRTSSTTEIQISLMEIIQPQKPKTEPKLMAKSLLSGKVNVYFTSKIRNLAWSTLGFKA